MCLYFRVLFRSHRDKSVFLIHVDTLVNQDKFNDCYIFMILNIYVYIIVVYLVIKTLYNRLSYFKNRKAILKVALPKLNELSQTAPIIESIVISNTHIIYNVIISYL